MSDLWVYVEEDIGMYLGMVLSGESVPGGKSRAGVVIWMGWIGD